MVPVTCCGTALTGMLSSISVYNGIFVSALSTAAKIAVVGTVYAREVCKISTTEKDRLI